MGVNLSDIVPAEQAELEDVAGQVVAIDAYNAIYQFLSVIRQPDGKPLMDQRGRVTSHLAGLLYRNANFLELGIRPVYVFDGTPHKLKARTIIERSERRSKAKREWEEAVEKGDYQKAFTKATQSSRITNEIVESSRILLSYLGIPVVQAPEEGEAQAAFMAAKGDAWAASSQDFDSLLFGAPRLVRNLTITGRRRHPGKDQSKEVPVEIILLDKVLEHVRLTREQLIDVCILMGTDFNEGVMGIGPKKGLKLMQEHGSLEKVMSLLQVEIEGYQEIRDIFLRYEVMREYRLEWREPDRDKVMSLLKGQYDFSEARVDSALKRMHPQDGRRKPLEGAQRSLDMFP
ncbi:MAG: flap endonuclease-1 [Methanomassiliicoccales archaeon]|nr:flap endonuclease-1 [Methanomassiliicoccales archaeon]MDD1756170.1 flap endonuclease-1 [Methanomassiliicoccales archaeon]